MKKIAKFIVKCRFLFLALFVAGAICCVFTISKVKINSDIKSYLPDKTETKLGIDIMAKEFKTFGSASIMVEDISYEDACRLADSVRAIPGVATCSVDDTPNHYNNGSALISVSFSGQSDDEETLHAVEAVKEVFKGEKTYISSDVGNDYNKQLAGEMGGVIAIAVIVIVLVLLFTSRSFFEVVIFFIVFGFAGILNMGTNYLLGEVSSITNSIAIILQLALAIDYSIIFSHRYQDEVANGLNEREALVEALSKAIVEIISSSLTTIAGLVALTLMQFKLGEDLGLVLTKGIICSILSVFLLMPCLIAIFPRMLRKTAHRNLVPDISGWGRFLVKSKMVFVVIFFIIIPFAFIFSGSTKYAFSDSSVDELIKSESRSIKRKISDNFGSSTAIAVIVPKGDYEKERQTIALIKEKESIKSVLGITEIEYQSGSFITDSYGVEDIMKLMPVDRASVEQLFSSYRALSEGLGSINKPLDGYKAPLIDLFSFLYNAVENKLVTLDEETTKTIYGLHDMLSVATDQLVGNVHDRIVVSTTLPAEGKESRKLVESIKSDVKKIYGSEEVLVIGDISSARDLSDSYTSDSIKISLLTIAFVFIIILCAFKSFVGSLILVFVIQGSIWINFSFPYLQSFSTSFVTNMIVSAIQMGATIDYAIVLMNRYLSNRVTLEKRQAAVKAVSESFATIVTSGSIMTIAGFLIAYRVSDVYVGHIGQAVGRGALISVILVLTVLPQLLVLCDGLIKKTTFHFGKKASNEES